MDERKRLWLQFYPDTLNKLYNIRNRTGLSLSAIVERLVHNLTEKEIEAIVFKDTIEDIVGSFPPQVSVKPESQKAAESPKKESQPHHSVQTTSSQPQESIEHISENTPARKFTLKL